TRQLGKKRAEDRRLASDHGRDARRLVVSESGTEDLDPGPVGRRSAFLPAPTPEREHSGIARPDAELVEDARLADTGLPAQQHDAATTGQGAGQVELELGELTLATDEDARPSCGLRVRRRRHRAR